jgi:two-component system cell cycle sensor histidine kinase/response regulator CckA
VVSAADPAEALRLGEAEEGALDVLVVDVVLPRLPGPELVKRLRRHHPTASVLFISGMTAEAAALTDDADRRSGFLSKPFTSAALSQKVRELIAPAAP